MKNILHIAKNDIKRVVSSVVAIVIVFGICVVPCLYAWFNIFSNWDPYGEDATGRLRVAIASEDEGTELMGIKLNVGEELITGLKANTQIGWTVVDSEKEALNALYAGEYYAAIIVTEDFSKDVVSFLSGNLSNPTLLYFENDKKNAVAPQITSKAKTSVQDEVNSTIVQTLTDTITEIVYVADANGITFSTVSDELIGDMDDLENALDLSLAMVEACEGLSDASLALLDMSSTLLGDSDAALAAAEDLAKFSDEQAISQMSRAEQTTASVNSSLAQINRNLKTISKDITKEFNDLDSYNSFYLNTLASTKSMVLTIENNCYDMADNIEALGLQDEADSMRELAASQAAIYAKLSDLEAADKNTWTDVKYAEGEMLDDLQACIDASSDLQADLSEKIAPQIQHTLDRTDETLKALTALTESLRATCPALSAIIGNFTNSVNELMDNLWESKEILKETCERLDTLRAVLSNIEADESLTSLTEAVTNDGDMIGEYLANPIRMDNVIIYDIKSYGSAMASFYTVLAIWVGALICAVLYKLHVRECDRPENLKIHEEFFGRYVIVFLTALVQGALVAAGDLWYINIDCPHPWMFLGASIIIAIVFSLINYSLVFALDNVGMAISVIIMLLQVAGGGGTFPIQLLAEPFGYIYPYMPFLHAMNAMKECIGGIYENTYAISLLYLLLTAVIFVIAGLCIYKPAQVLNNIIIRSKEKSEIMN